jgi:phosphoglycerol transferase MdoB-like AlkP superfamily enzyme
MLFIAGIGTDLVFLLSLTAVLLVPFCAIAALSLRVARVLYALGAAIIFVGHMMLVEYFISTNNLLGADLFGYSWSEIQLTVRSSSSVTVVSFLPSIIGLMLLGALLFATRKFTVPRRTSYAVCSIAVIVAAFSGTLNLQPSEFQSEAEYDLAANKTSFFLQRTWLSVTAKEGSGDWMGPEYPLYRSYQYNDVLGPFFAHSDLKPNLVFVIVEGLGRDFVGRGAAYGGFTPFLDSLSEHSLYFENFLSTSGRTFNVLPSLFGSLPYGAKGFMALGEQSPAHQTMISLLRMQDYCTSFYYGGNANFDLQDVFLEHQGIDFIIDEFQFGPKYTKGKPGESGFSWGYVDGDVFKRSLEIINEHNRSPRLDIYLTLTTHEPFVPPDSSLYSRRFEQRLSALGIPAKEQQTYRAFRAVFSTLLYLDDALRFLLHEYGKRPDYSRTIFFITGDHRLIPVPIGDQIDRFRVPFIIWSPLLRRAQKFSSVSTHADVTPSVLAFLQKQYNVQLPEKAHWLADGIDTSHSFRNTHAVPLMRNKNELIDYLDRSYYLAGDLIFRVSDGLSIQEVSQDSIREALRRKLQEFKRVNRYVCDNHRLYPGSQLRREEEAYTASDDSVFGTLGLEGLNSDQLFEVARQNAFNAHFTEARVICRRLLRTSPNYHDVRTLLGRTYAWQKRYELARPILREVLRRGPAYTDALSALLDIELWLGNYRRAVDLADSVLARYPSNEDFQIRKARALGFLDRRDEAVRILDHVVAVNPSNLEAIEAKKRLGI